MADKIDNGGYAFPFKKTSIENVAPEPPIGSNRKARVMLQEVETVSPGMTMRDWFAGMALQGILANSHPQVVKQFMTSYEIDDEAFAENAYFLADQMLKFRGEK